MKMAPRRNLVLVHTPSWQGIEDFERLKRQIEAEAPDIEVFIAYNTIPSSVTTKKAAGRPTFVFSPDELKVFRPRRGTVASGRYIAKTEQMRLLEWAGLPVPKWAVLEPKLRLGEAEWGEFVILKPLAPEASSYGEGIQLMRTRRVRFRPPDEYPVNHPGRLGPMLVQAFIDTGPRSQQHRVLTLFGEPLYCQVKTLGVERVPLDASDEDIEAGIIATNAAGVPVHRELASSQELLDLARQVHAAVPDVPLKGIDFLRDHHTGRFYCIEFNPGGQTWHLSSAMGRTMRAEQGRADLVGSEEADRRARRDIETQFGFFETAARTLIEQTRTRAV